MELPRSSLSSLSPRDVSWVRGTSVVSIKLGEVEAEDSYCHHGTMLFLGTLEEEEGQEGEGRREMAEALLSALTDRHQQRQTWRDR
ncbi:GTP 3'8-cyclase [Dissostichus eleginoides]|uniref:GTP 3'8-cyclase n=1 Tax=Dissostichus eleginoides TaxID=100907 RepID=A0AAD9BVE5_DISEL|nr:GTP 3'8-cyclase [Dissostichus eleginoides]